MPEEKDAQRLVYSINTHWAQSSSIDWLPDTSNSNETKVIKSDTYIQIN